jgi:hypothetical protein
MSSTAGPPLIWRARASKSTCPVVDQVIDAGGPAFEIRICRIAASENELVSWEQLIARA